MRDCTADEGSESLRLVKACTRLPFSFGRIAPTPGVINQFFNDSTGVGDQGEIDTSGTWNEGPGWVRRAAE
jgi:Mn-containing catalase